MQEEHQETSAAQTEVAPSRPNEDGMLVRRGTDPAGLTPIQEIAMQRLLAGSSIAQAACAAKVDRRTVYRWLQSDPRFAAAYNAWQREMVASGRARVLAMNDLALDTVQNAMLRGDVRVAVQIAKANGALDAPNPGTTDPSYFYHRKKQRDRARRKAIEKAERDERWKQATAPERNPAHCEYMIDTYIKCRRDALRAESPENRARRLEQQPQYRRNYDPMTLRLLATLDAEEPLGDAPAAVPAGSPADPPPTDGREADAHAPTSATEAFPAAEVTDRATEPNATEAPAAAAAGAPADLPPDNPDAPTVSPVPAAFPGARPAPADPPEPPPTPPGCRPAPIRAVPNDGSDEDDNEPGVGEADLTDATAP